MTKEEDSIGSGEGASDRALGDTATASMVPSEPRSWVHQALKDFGPGLATGAADDTL